MASGDEIAIAYPQMQMGDGAGYGVPDRRNRHIVLNLAADDYAVFPLYVSQLYDGGGFTVDLFYSMVSATSGSITLQVSFERTTLNTDDTDSDSYATGKSVTDTVPGTAGVVKKATVTFSNSEIDGLTAGDIGRVRVRRTDAGGTGLELRSPCLVIRET
jgi:hypothetical protein